MDGKIAVRRKAKSFAQGLKTCKWQNGYTNPPVSSPEIFLLCYSCSYATATSVPEENTMVKNMGCESDSLALDANPTTLWLWDSGQIITS